MTSIAGAKAWHEKHERSLEESWKASSGLEIVIQNDVAAALGVSQSTISNFVKIGMPMTSVAAAKAWHEKRHHYIFKTPRGFYDLEASQVQHECARDGTLEFVPTEITVYLRLSGESQLGNNSLLMQHMDVFREKRDLGWSDIPHRTYTEVASAAECEDDMNQPILQDIIKNWKPGAVLLCSTADRFTRSISTSTQFYADKRMNN
jgi:hypothetical protein